ncbi:MAG TPA: GreA/GreB family elongation factor [Thermoanaerobaculia bacterium]|nr:GreA/GreB family elongation factor [Thermoanaerobaculia bacterium]
MPFREEAQQLLNQKKFDEVESLWMTRLDGDVSNVDPFLHAAKSLRKAEQRTMSDTLLGLLGDTLKEKHLWPQRLQVLKETGRLSKHPATLRPQIEEALKKALGSHKSFARAFAFVKFNDPQSNPVERAEKVEAWLTYDEGECFFMPGRGAGCVTELNPELGICRLDFEKEKRVSVPLGAAGKFLTRLPEGHVLREKFTRPEELRTEATTKPAEFFARILQSFRRPMTMVEVRDAVIGIVPEEKWSSWWTAARKNPQVVVSGTGAKATYSWTTSAAGAEATIRREFERADVKSKLDLAKKHSARGKELADDFSSTLSAEAARLARTDAATAWQILATLESLPGTYEPPFEPSSLLSGPMASRTVAAISDKPLREKALAVVRQTHPDWTKVYGEMFFLEEEPRILTQIMGALDETGQTDVVSRLVDETLRYPRRHPRAFYWYAKRLADDEKLSDRANYALLFQILDAISSDEFAPVKARLRDLFEKGAFVIRVILAQNNEEQARKFIDAMERHGSVEEYRREMVRHATLMKHPTLREPQAEPIYATADAFAQKRAELDQLLKVEIPANKKAIQTAREFGDLSENFEYKSARQRAGYLSARVGKLQGELANVHVIDPARIDTAAVRVGTKIVLTNGDVRREVTILGPWESAPEKGVYSNQSEVATALIGHASGDIVTFMGNDYQIESIRKWNE